jgi:hypothetical protein
MSPWPFSFAEGHQDEVAALRSEFEAVFIILVCGLDGVVCLTSAEYRQLLDDNFRPMEWIKAARSRHERYTLTGSDVVKALKIADSDYPLRIYEALDELDRKEIRGRHGATVAGDAAPVAEGVS